MTVTATSLGSRAGPKSSRRRLLRRRGKTASVPILCPYLIAEDGAWRSSHPSRDHRCGALAPAAPLALDKQRRLCLAKAHATCATHLAALAEATGRSFLASAPEVGGSRGALPAGTTRWSLVRTAPVVLDVAGGGAPGGPGRRRVGQWALGGVMALALGAVVLARLPEAAPVASAAPAVLGATGQPAAAAAASATPRPRAAVVTPAPEPAGASGSALLSPSPSSRPPSATSVASPTGSGVHVVVAGDTLSALARAYETTIEALQAANDMGDATTLQIGQELKLP